MNITLMGMVAALCVDILLAYFFGASEKVDAFIIAATIPFLIDTVLREGGRFCLLPIFIKKKQNADAKSYNTFINAHINSSLLVGILLGVLIYLGAESIITSIGHGLKDSTYISALKMLQIMSPIIIFSAPSIMITLVHNANNVFFVTGLRNLVVPLTVIGFILLQSPDINIINIAQGYTCGFFIYITLIWGLLFSFKFKFTPHVFLNREEIKDILHRVKWPTLSILMGQSIRVIERSIATGFAVGGVTQYYFAFRIYSAIQSLIGASIATTGLPKIIKGHLLNDKQSFKKDVLQLIKTVIMISAPVMLLMVFFSEYIIEILFGFGSFQDGDIVMAGKILTVLSFGIVFNSIMPVIGSILQSAKENKLFFYVTIFYVTTYFVLVLFFSRQFELIGIAIALVVAAALNVSYGLWALRKMNLKM